jgi:hypothetical protein
MKFIKYFSIALCLLSMAACSEDFFTPVVDINLEPHKSRLVVFASFQVESDSLVVHLTRSRSALDTAQKRLTIQDTFWVSPTQFTLLSPYTIEADTLKNAKVELFRNDVLWGTFSGNRFGKYTLRQKLPNDGATYRLRAEAAGFDVVEAIQKMPPIVKLDSVRYVKDGAVIQDGFDTYKEDEFTFFFKDAPELGNYYTTKSVYFRKYRGGLYPQPLYIASLDKLAQSDILGDKSFNDNTYNWRNHGRLYQSPESGERIEYTLFTTTAETFQFVRSQELNNNARDNPFAEPVILYSNIKNGYGLFSLSATSTWIKRF